MTQREDPLDRLRREIDRIDDALHDLLMRRTAAVESIREVKRAQGDAILRPAREAEVLRRLVARHHGPFSKHALVRIWREIMAAQTRVQGPFSIAVFAPAGRAELWDIARDHFGSTTPSRRHETTRGVLRAVGEGEATVGVLPLPSEDDGDPWWPALAGREPHAPSIVARLPFAPPEMRGGPQALAVGLLTQERSAHDHSFIVVETDGGTSRRTLASALAAAGLDSLFLAHREAHGSDGDLFLAEIGDFVGRADPRLASLFASDNPPIRRIVPAGGYALPLAEPDLAAGERT
jgi:chorismate mutase-like protein